jgi:hypothetical protein
MSADAPYAAVIGPLEPVDAGSEFVAFAVALAPLGADLLSTGSIMGSTHRWADLARLALQGAMAETLDGRVAVCDDLDAFMAAAAGFWPQVRAADGNTGSEAP